MDKCEYCGSELECLGGQPAHKSNWVCTNGWCKKPTVIRGDKVKSSSEPTCSIADPVDLCAAVYHHAITTGEEYTRQKSLLEIENALLVIFTSPQLEAAKRKMRGQ